MCMWCDAALLHLLMSDPFGIRQSACGRSCSVPHITRQRTAADAADHNLSLAAIAARRLQLRLLGFGRAHPNMLPHARSCMRLSHHTSDAHALSHTMLEGICGCAPLASIVKVAAAGESRAHFQTAVRVGHHMLGWRSWERPDMRCRAEHTLLAPARRLQLHMRTQNSILGAARLSPNQKQGMSSLSGHNSSGRGLLAVSALPHYADLPLDKATHLR